MGQAELVLLLPKQLSEQGHSITVIDQSSEDIQKIDESLDVKAIVGKGHLSFYIRKSKCF